MSTALKIRVRCPSVSPLPVQLEACNPQTTFADFQRIVLRALGVLGEEETGTPPTILAGFPPRPLQLPQDAAIGSALSDNESITVRLASQAASVANPEGGKWGREKRSAAARSRTSSRTSRSTSSTVPPDDESGTRPAAKTKGKTGNGNKAGSDGGPSAASGGTGVAGGRGIAGTVSNGVHSLAGPLTPSPLGKHPSGRTVAGARRASGITQGSSRGQVRTLFGSGSSNATAGRAVDSPASGEQPRKRSRAGTGVSLSSEGDIADRLLQAVGGGGRATVDRFFRKAMKLAVDKQYDQSRADARVRAALGGLYTAEASATQRRLGDGESVALKLSFSKGLGAKGQFEETVDRIPREQVSAVVRLIARDPESREMLKPHNFAGCSPRMFWSLVEYWGGDVPCALRLAAPDVDWNFLEVRDRKPSEKAVANALAEEEQLKQAEEEKAEKQRRKEAKQEERKKKRDKREGMPADQIEGHVFNAGASPTPPMQDIRPASERDAPESVDGSDLAPTTEVTGRQPLAAAAPCASDARQRAANAALSRLVASQEQAQSHGRTMTAGTERGAVDAAAPAPGDAEAHETKCVTVGVDMVGLTEVAGEEGAQMLSVAGIRTLGQLADQDEDQLIQQLRAYSERTPASRGSGTMVKTLGNEQVSAWVQAARGEELDEIMAAIVGDDEEVVEALEEVAVSTPRDLVRLGAFPDVLVEAVRDRIGAKRWAPLEARITMATVDAWRAKGEAFLQQRPWLELWVHEV